MDLFYNELVLNEVILLSTTQKESKYVTRSRKNGVCR